MQKRITKPAITYCVLLLALLPIPTFALMMPFERIATINHNEVPLGAVENMAEDSRGFIWVASHERLARYEGTGFQYYGDSPGDTHGYCAQYNNDIFLDSRNDLWVATDMVLCRYNAQKNYFEIYSLPLADNNEPIHPNFTALAEDANHNLLIGGKGGLFILNANRSSAIYYPLPAQASFDSSDTEIQTILVDSKHRVWLGTRNLGVVKFDIKQAQFGHINSMNVSGVAEARNAQSIVEDVDGQLWIGYFGQGVERYNIETGAREHFVDDKTGIGTATVWNILRDSHDNLWFGIDNGDKGGLAQYNRDTGKFEYQYYEDSNPYSLSSDKAITVFEDRQKNLWVTTYPSGIHFYHHKNKAVQNYRKSFKYSSNQLNDNGILSFFEEDDGTVLVGTEKGLNRFNPKTQQITNLSDNNSTFSLPIQPITAITKDASGYYWIGTWNHGIYRVNFATQESKHFLASREKGKLNTNIIWNFILDGDKGLWIATQNGGMNYFDFSTEQFTALMPTDDPARSVSSTHFYDMLQDQSQNYWLSGADGLDYYQPKTGEVKHYSGQKGNRKTIPSQRLWALLLDKKQRLWVSTIDEGVFVRDPVTEEFMQLTVKQGLPSAHVTALTEDAMGNIWAGTLLGLALIDGETFAIKKFNQSQGILATTINRGANMLSRDGFFYSGGTEGFSLFKPETLDYKQHDFPIYITRLKVSNKAIHADHDNKILKDDISQTQTIELQHQDNMFAFDFAALSYHLPNWNRYAYLLEGFDKNWNEIGSSHSATFTNIPPGDYVFRVKATNAEGLWSEKTASVNIHILPPLWRTLWAYALYALLAAFVITFFYRYKIEKIEHEKNKELNNELLKLSEIKDAFLANTSHELRTPIHGMVGMAEALARESSGASKSQREKIQLIISSGKRLSSLINDILDYSKMADQHIELYKSLVDINRMVKQIFEITAILKKNKNLELINNISSSAKFLYADANRMEQILINLVSNAIKYSDNGQVIISSEILDDHFILIVQDSGIGMDEVDLARLFNPFSQLESSANRRAGGTGLGLTVTRHLIERHHGDIRVTSAIGMGSRFVLSFPYAETRVQLSQVNIESLQEDESEEIAEQTSFTASKVVTAASPDNTAIEANTEETELIQALIADDDPVNCMILQQLMKLGGYAVITAYDGAMALDALEQNTDIAIIVLDVNMPKMNGFEVAEKIRGDSRLQKLPILFLTANITDKELQANEKIGNSSIQLKPINKNFLHATLKELMSKTNT
ncbi:MAG: two-component regulator propeller domain-containing protein [Pseudomonadota bacterium]